MAVTPESLERLWYWALFGWSVTAFIFAPGAAKEIGGQLAVWRNETSLFTVEVSTRYKILGAMGLLRYEKEKNSLTSPFPSIFYAWNTD